MAARLDQESVAAQSGVIEVRVFNISLHRMATRSMWCAFDALGFVSIHHPLQLIELYEENLVERYAPLRYDNIALGDIPIPLMYRKLYKLFPEARFVLVTRPFEDWFKSVQSHLRHPLLPDAAVKEHTLLYGYPITKDDCDEDLCRKVFDRHHADAQEFFREQGFLLTLELSTLSWEQLCSFLARPTPDRQFPQLTGN